MTELKQLKFPAIYSQLARDFIAASPRMKKLGVPLNRAYQLLRIPEKTLTDPHTSIRGDQMQVLMAAGNLLADKTEPFGLQLARLFKEDTLGVLGLAIVNSHTAEEALNTFQQYAFIYSPGIDYHISRQSGWVDITLTPLVKFDPTVEKIMLHMIFCAFAFYIRSSGLDVQPQYYLPHSLDAAHKQALEKFTDSKVITTAAQARLRLPESVLQSPIKNPNTAMHALYIEQLKQQAESARDDESFGLRACRLLEHHARQGEFFSRDELALEMAVSVRTLNRKLKDDGLSFQPLLDQARFNIARRLLAESNKTTKQIAFECGIQNPAVFCRAFKKWSGKTPGDFRKDYQQVI